MKTYLHLEEAMKDLLKNKNEKIKNIRVKKKKFTPNSQAVSPRNSLIDNSSIMVKFILMISFRFTKNILM